MDECDLWPARNFTASWTERWRASPAHHVLQDLDGRWLTRGEVDERSAAFARGLEAAGLARGDRLLIVAGADAAFVIAYVGALRAGLTVVPVNPAYTEPEMRRLVGAAGPAAGVARGVQAQWLESAGVRLVDPARHGVRAQGGAPLDTAGIDDVALLIFTSGTTGEPKGVPLTHGNLLASATAVGEAWEWSAEDRLLLALPLFHVHGLGVGLHGALCAGASVILRPGFDAADVARCAPDATMFFGVPAMYDRLARAGAARALSGLRLIVSGSAPLPAALGTTVAAEAGQMPLERYGMTETVMLTGNPLDGERRPGTVGFPFPGVSLRLGAGDEIEVRGPNVINGYLGGGPATAAAFTPDGWFRTGDIGAFDSDGYLRIVGRSKEVIITGGFNVMPREVEEILATFPGVREVAVIGRPSERWGEEVTAVVVLDGATGELNSEALRAYAAERLTTYKVPKRVEVVAELPRNAMGKVVRSAL